MVYVDNAKIRYGRMRMSHMAADTLDELHDMADKIGVGRVHFQDKLGKPHYDICQKKRVRALDFGAKEVSTKELIIKFQSK